MINFFLRSVLVLIISLISCTKQDEIGCWKCTIKKTGSVKTKTVCGKTIQEANNQVLTEELSSGGSNMNVHCKRD